MTRLRPLRFVVLYGCFLQYNWRDYFNPRRGVEIFSVLTRLWRDSIDTDTFLLSIKELEGER